MVDLGTPGGYSSSEARDVNDLGQIVGSSAGTALLWESGDRGR